MTTIPPMTIPQASRDWIRLDGFSFPCVLGLLDWEQQTHQTLAVELSLGLDLDGAASGELDRSVNYAATLEQVQFVAEAGRWRLLESMGAAMARLLLAPPAPGEGRAQVEEVFVRLGKPDVFKGRAVPSVELRRQRQWCQLGLVRTAPAGVRIEILQESRESGAYRVHLAKEATWSPPPQLSCLVIAGAVQKVGVSPDRFQSGQALGRGGRELRGLTDQEACLLVVGELPLSRAETAREMP